MSQVFITVHLQQRGTGTFVKFPLMHIYQPILNNARVFIIFGEVCGDYNFPRLIVANAVKREKRDIQKDTEVSDLHEYGVFATQYTT
jgi:hypothetical protein